MRNTYFLFTFIALSFNSYSQSKEGYIRYTADVTPIDSTEENLQASKFFRQSKIEIYYSENCCRVDYQTGEISRTSTIGDRSKNIYLFLANNGKTKIAQKITLDSIPPSQTLSDGIVTINKDSLKEILGLKCYYVCLTKNGKKSTYWCTDNIKINFHGKSIVDSQIPGFPMVIRKEEMGFIFTYTVSNLKDYIEDRSVFSTDIPPGYKDASEVIKQNK